MEKRKFNKAEDFIMELSFVDFVLNKSSSNEFWSDFIIRNPDLKVEIEKAEELVTLLNKSTKEDVLVDKDQELDRLLLKIKSQPKIIKLTQKIIKYAALFVVLIASLFFLSQLETIKYKTYQSDDSSTVITLNDNSKIFLNKESNIKVSRLYGIYNRDIKLMGEAFFNVTANKDSKFIVSCSNSKVTVLGTQFNVKTETNKTEVMVKKGRVSLKPLDAESEIILKKQIAGIYDSHNGLFEIDFNINNFAWQSGEFSFNNMSLSEIVDGLGSYYNYTFRLSNNYSKKHLSFHVSKMDIEEVLKLLQELIPDLNYKINDTSITIY